MSALILDSSRRGQLTGGMDGLAARVLDANPNRRRGSLIKMLYKMSKQPQQQQQAPPQQTGHDRWDSTRWKWARDRMIAFEVQRKVAAEAAAAKEQECAFTAAATARRGLGRSPLRGLYTADEEVMLRRLSIDLGGALFPDPPPPCCALCGLPDEVLVATCTWLTWGDLGRLDSTCGRFHSSLEALSFGHEGSASNGGSGTAGGGGAAPRACCLSITEAAARERCQPHRAGAAWHDFGGGDGPRWKRELHWHCEGWMDRTDEHRGLRESLMRPGVGFAVASDPEWNVTRWYTAPAGWKNPFTGKLLDTQQVPVPLMTSS